MPTLDQASRPSATAVPLPRGPARPRSLIASWTLRVGTPAALGIDAAIHLQNASAYDAVTATLSQGELFRIEAVLAVAVGLLVLLWPRRGSWVAAVLVGASALGAVLLYRYVDLGALGPLPNMYENTWQVPANCNRPTLKAPPWCSLDWACSALLRRRRRGRCRAGSQLVPRSPNLWRYRSKAPICCGSGPSLGRRCRRYAVCPTVMSSGPCPWRRGLVGTGRRPAAQGSVRC